MTSLAAYYERLGYPPSRWHVGAEHPHLEGHAIALLRTMPRARVLELGYQAGGFAVPVILALRDRPDFAYVGVDSMVYGSAVDGAVLARYLEERGVTGCYRFLAGDAAAVLPGLQDRFDLVLIDHDKRLYPRELRAVLGRGLVSDGGVVLLHDVLGKAARVWPDCLAIARAAGWSASIVAEIPDGLGVLRREARDRRVALADRARLLPAIARIRGRRAVDAVRRWTARRPAGA